MDQETRIPGMPVPESGSEDTAQRAPRRRRTAQRTEQTTETAATQALPEEIRNPEAGQSAPDAAPGVQEPPAAMPETDVPDKAQDSEPMQSMPWEAPFFAASTDVPDTAEDGESVQHMPWEIPAAAPDTVQDSEPVQPAMLAEPAPEVWSMMLQGSIYCPECGVSIPAEAMFCPECGCRIQGEPPMPADPTPQPAANPRMPQSVPVWQPVQPSQPAAAQPRQPAFGGRIGQPKAQTPKRQPAPKPKEQPIFGNTGTNAAKKKTSKIPLWAVIAAAAAVLCAVGVIFLPKLLGNPQPSDGTVIADLPAAQQTYAAQTADGPVIAQQPAAVQDPAVRAAVMAVQPGDMLSFGTYPQGASGEMQPIDWQVLAREDDRVLLISRYAIDAVPYNDTLTDVTWETCSLRKWLNDTFLKQAFSASQQSAVQTTLLDNSETQYIQFLTYSDVAGSAETQDKVFLLSFDEAFYRYRVDRSTAGTLYARKTKNVDTYTDYGESQNKCRWWLRSPGRYGRSEAVAIYYNGIMQVSDNDRPVNDAQVGVRPALWVDLNATTEIGLPESVAPLPTSKALTEVDRDSIDVGDRVTFGSYPQTASGERLPIEWEVLEYEDNCMLLCSCYALDNRRFYSDYREVTWETSEIRCWLSADFVAEAFSPYEQAAILTVEKVTPDPDWYSILKSDFAMTDEELMMMEYENIRACPNTYDDVFLLSAEEVAAYWPDPADRCAKPTAYALTNGAEQSTDEEGWGNCMWLMRSHGNWPCYVSCVDTAGARNAGVEVNDAFAIRPALWVDLSDL